MLSALHPALTLLFCRRHSQALHLLAPLFPPGNNSARTRVVKRLTAMAMPDPDLNAELLRLRLIGQETAELLPQLLELPLDPPSNGDRALHQQAPGSNKD